MVQGAGEDRPRRSRSCAGSRHRPLDPVREVQWRAEDALEKIVPVGEEALIAAIPDFVAALDDPVWDVQWSAQHALGKIGPAAAPALVAALANPDAGARQNAAKALARIGPDAAGAAPALVAALLDRSGRVQWRPRTHWRRSGRLGSKPSSPPSRPSSPP
jgi:hypothetical protein